MIGRVISVNGGNYKVYLNNDIIIDCKCSGRLRYMKLSKTSSFNISSNTNSKKLSTNTLKISPKAGDFVELEIEHEKGLIIGIEKEKMIIRPDIANIDQIFLLFAAKKPDFSFFLLDLFLVNIEKAKIKPIIIISKIDLMNEFELKDLVTKMKYYQEIGYMVIYVNSLEGKNIELITPLLKDKVTILAGQTGAGKSSLINALIPGFKLQTQEISHALGRGKHTTRVVSLYRFCEGFIGDTPGFSKLDLSDIEKKDLGNYFIEFSKYKCKFSNCLHEINSLGCSIYNNENILSSRVENYLKILNDSGKKD